MTQGLDHGLDGSQRHNQVGIFREQAMVGLDDAERNTLY